MINIIIPNNKLRFSCDSTDNPQESLISLIARKILSFFSGSEKATASRAFQGVTIDPSTLLNTRKPLIDYLRQYLTLDDFGYPVNEASHSLETLKFACVSILNPVEDPFELMAPKEMSILEDIFRQVAKAGDAGYAHDIRTFLAGHGISSPQFKKGDNSNQLKDPIRPHSCANGRQGIGLPPPCYQTTRTHQPALYRYVGKCYLGRI